VSPDLTFKQSTLNGWKLHTLRSSVDHASHCILASWYASCCPPLALAASFGLSTSCFSAPNIGINPQRTLSAAIPRHIPSACHVSPHTSVDCGTDSALSTFNARVPDFRIELYLRGYQICRQMTAHLLAFRPLASEQMSTLLRVELALYRAGCR